MFAYIYIYTNKYREVDLFEAVCSGNVVFLYGGTEIRS